MLRRSITCLLAVGAFSALLTFSPQKALALPTLQIEGGILTGATGVDVGGTLYDVQFVDGTCVALFNGCDHQTDFPFQTKEQADAASTALFAQVLLDSPMGAFDTNPQLTQGCGYLVFCDIHTPISLMPSLGLYSSGARNITQPHPVPDTLTAWGNSPMEDFGSSPLRTWARWEVAHSTPVPEPTTLTLFGLGLGALVLWNARWRQHAGNQVG